MRYVPIYWQKKILFRKIFWRGAFFFAPRRMILDFFHFSVGFRGQGLSSKMAFAAFLPAPMARMTVAAPVTASPPA